MPRAGPTRGLGGSRDQGSSPACRPRARRCRRAKERVCDALLVEGVVFDDVVDGGGRLGRRGCYGVATGGVDLALHGLTGDTDLDVVIDLQPDDVAIETVMKPYMPEVVMTSSPSASALCSDCCSRWRRRCGRMRRKYAPTSINGRKAGSSTATAVVFSSEEGTEKGNGRWHHDVQDEYATAGAGQRESLLSIIPNSEHLSAHRVEGTAVMACASAPSTAVSRRCCGCSPARARGFTHWNRWRMYRASARAHLAAAVASIGSSERRAWRS